MGKKTVVMGASPNPGRYAFQATKNLSDQGHETVPVGIKKGEINDIPILNLNEKPVISGVDTISLYLGSKNQQVWYDYMLSLSPKRIIFNPGTENPEFAEMASEKGIETLEACTLVMLSVGNY